MKKIAIIGSVGIPANYGGFETLTENLVDQLSERYEITVFCSKKSFKSAERKKNHKGARLLYIPIKPNGISSILYDYVSIIRALFFADTLLILGVSGCTLLPFIRFFSRKKIIVNIDGLEWKRKKWNRMARWFLHLSEYCAVKYSHADIADNKAIQRYTALYYGSISNVIAYGGPVILDKQKRSDLESKYPFTSDKYYVKVARIEPENNIEMVLDAFSEMDEKIVLIGNWQHSTYARALKKKYKDLENVLLLDPIYKKDEINYIRRKAYAYIHGHEAGGTNPSLVEAMCCRLPVIAYDVSFNRETTNDEAIYFKNNKDLKLIVRYASSDVLDLNARCMRFTAMHNYNWETIANQYDSLLQRVHQSDDVKEQVQRIPDTQRALLKTEKFESIISKHSIKTTA
jgi:glycosyltransferase involved in cell wall biosynthesis